MHDAESQFFVATADLCAAARLGGLEIEIVLRSGERLTGVPSAPAPARARGEELDETGYSRTLLLADVVVDLAEIRRCAILAPGSRGSSPG